MSQYSLSQKFCASVVVLSVLCQTTLVHAQIRPAKEPVALEFDYASVKLDARSHDRLFNYFDSYCRKHSVIVDGQQVTSAEQFYTWLSAVDSGQLADRISIDGKSIDFDFNRDVLEAGLLDAKTISEVFPDELGRVAAAPINTGSPNPEILPVIAVAVIGSVAGSVAGTVASKVVDKTLAKVGEGLDDLVHPWEREIGRTIALGIAHVRTDALDELVKQGIIMPT